jgi:hypothetical protein
MTPEDRAWEVVRRAFEERTPQPGRRDRRWVLAAVAVGAGVLVAAALSPPGRAVFERVRQAVGVEHASPALLSLPGGGRLTVVSPGGRTWIVEPDGLKRHLGSYDDAAWSPHGVFLAATHGNQLAVVDPQGATHWSLARLRPRNPTWSGTRTDTRIAYDAASWLRVVAGDGTGDHLLDAKGGSVPPAWNPVRLFTLAYAVPGAVVLRRDDGTLVWRRPLAPRATSLAWSSDGRWLAVFTPTRVLVLDRAGRLRRTISQLGAGIAGGAFAPGSHRLAVVVRPGRRSEVHVVDLDRPGTGKLVLAGPGTFGDVVWSPTGSWLLVTWPAADQWVFLHGSRAHAVGNIRSQFGGATHVTGDWCCSR